MAEDYGEGINPVDQGTIVMLCLAISLGILAGFWFGCKWYMKRREKEGKSFKMHRPRLKQTFSRFSQVDEEVTMHNINEQDIEILQSYSSNTKQDPQPGAAQAEQGLSTEPVPTEPKQTTLVAETHVTMTTESNKPYLETDI